MEAVLIRVLAPLLNYFGLATLRDALQGPAAPFHGELVRRVVRVLIPVALGAVTAQHGAFIHDPVSVSCARSGGIAKPTKTPLFHAITERLVALLNDALRSLRAEARSAFARTEPLQTIKPHNAALLADLVSSQNGPCGP